MTPRPASRLAQDAGSGTGEATATRTEFWMKKVPVKLLAVEFQGQRHQARGGVVDVAEGIVGNAGKITRERHAHVGGRASGGIRRRDRAEAAAGRITSVAYAERGLLDAASVPKGAMPVPWTNRSAMPEMVAESPGASRKPLDHSTWACPAPVPPVRWRPMCKATTVLSTSHRGCSGFPPRSAWHADTGRRLPAGFESSGDRIEGATVLLGGADAPVKVPPTWSSHRLAADEPNVARWLSVLLKSAK